MNHGLERFMRELDSTDAGVRAAAAREMASLGESAAAAALPLVRCCGDGNEDVREWAVAALEECGPPNVDDADALATLLTDPSADVAYWAATLLGRLQQAAKPSVSFLLAALSARSEPAVRQRIVWALGEIGAAAIDALSVLEALAVGGGDPRLQRLAERACERIRG